MRFTGILVCLLAMQMASAPCRAQSAKPADAPAANPAQPAPKKTATPSKAKSAKKAPEPVQQSFITFYWPQGSDSPLFEVLRERVSLSVDGQPAGKLTQGEYISVPVQPGHHTYGYERLAQFSDGEIKHEVDVPQGQSIYFEIIDKEEAGIVHTTFLKEVAAETAQAELAKLKQPLQTAPKEAVAGVAGALPAAMAAVSGVRAAAPPAGVKPGKKGAGPQPVQQSYITFYWPKRTSGTVAFLETFKEHLGIAIDDQSAGSFSEGEYISIPVQPGPHTYSYARTSQIGIGAKRHSVDVAQGQSVYFEIDEQEQGMVTVIFPQQVAAEQASPALSNLKAPGKDE